ncbi:MAG: hypothetical protein K0S08_593 [Gammaproteobacteria bacterium]|jgi:N-methylhydantoinase A/oxoprolinase/acetone carboxylase beta subunit|nr:hypothetical protein [Gammaproteobacteria bacterium]
MKKYILGIDVGGTHVDFVIVDQQQKIYAYHKEVIGNSAEKTILNGIGKLMREQNFLPQDCSSVHLGTTIGVNSLLALQNVSRVGLIRVAGHQPDLLPAYQWSVAQRAAILAGYETINGGKEFNNKSITRFDVQALKLAVKKLLDAGAQSLGIVSVFSPLYTDEELKAAEIILNEFGAEIPLTLSHEVGGLGFIERENNVLINASLKQVMRENFSFLQKELHELGFSCECYITQNNGTLLHLDEAIRFPIKTLSSGPTNSLVGACKLAGLSDAIIVDIGGTSTDIGIIENAFPRYSSAGAVIAGIATNFMLPDVHVLPLGGGSIIEKLNGEYQIQPVSLGAKVFQECKSAGGAYLTLFDIGNILNHGKAIDGVSCELAEKLMQEVCARIKALAHSIPAKTKLPVILVGGGVQNIPEAYLDKDFYRPHFYQVANAYGAALAEVACTVDVVQPLMHDKESTLQALEQQAMAKAIAQGVDPKTVRIIEKRLLPFFYMPNQMTRIIITAAGRKI